MSMKALVVLALLLAVAGFFVFGGGDFLALETIKAQQLAWQQDYRQSPLLFIGGFALVYVAVTALSLPGAALLSLVAAALFGLWVGFWLVSFASTVGATLAFLSARFLFRDWVARRFSRVMKRIDQGVERDGALYLFSLRLVPVVPFFLINLGMGLTKMPTWRFVWVSQLGMAPGTWVYVNAGTELGRLQGLDGLLSLPLLGAFALLAVFPWVARWAMEVFRRWALYRPWRGQKPKRFDANLVVIGGGAAGLVSAYIAAAVKAKVVLVEKARMGGDCLNTGCVPSKALLRSARFLHDAKHADALGLETVSVDWRFQGVMARVRRVIAKVAPHDSVERYQALGVDCREGEARLLNPWTVSVRGAGGQEELIHTRAVVLATGARPFVPPIPGLAEVPFLTTETVWGLENCPRHLLVIGAGPVACELAQAFVRLGAKVSVAVRGRRLLRRDDAEAAQYLLEQLRQEGVEVCLQAPVVRVENGGGGEVLLRLDGDRVLRGDALLLATGRRARSEGLGLEALGLALDEASGRIACDDKQVTRLPNITVAGDAGSALQFTHVAAHTAWYATVNALFGGFKRFAVDWRVIPRVSFTDPGVACVGLTESQADDQGLVYEVSRFDLSQLDRAITDEQASGFIKVLTAAGSDRILGVTIVATEADQYLAEFALAMRHGLGLKKLLATVHAYPTLGEGVKMVAGLWQREHVPQRLLRCLARYQRWRRGMD